MIEVGDLMLLITPCFWNFHPSFLYKIWSCHLWLKAFVSPLAHRLIWTSFNGTTNKNPYNWAHRTHRCSISCHASLSLHISADNILKRLCIYLHTVPSTSSVLILVLPWQTYTCRAPSIESLTAIYLYFYHSLYYTVM